jgi:hypothetical protein
MDIPPGTALAIQRERRRLGLARSLLKCLSVASMYDEKIDASSAGVAEVACRLIEETINHLELAELCRGGEKSEPAGATT